MTIIKCLIQPRRYISCRPPRSNCLRAKTSHYHFCRLSATSSTTGITLMVLLLLLCSFWFHKMLLEQPQSTPWQVRLASLLFSAMLLILLICLNFWKPDIVLTCSCMPAFSTVSQHCSNTQFTFVFNNVKRILLCKPLNIGKTKVLGLVALQKSLVPCQENMFLLAGIVVNLQHLPPTARLTGRTGS